MNKVKEIVEFVLGDIGGRKGIGDELDMIDEDIKEDMINGWESEIHDIITDEGQNQKDKINKTIDGLIDTAVEKVLSLGVEGAVDDIIKIKMLIEDLICFWGIEKDWEIEIEDRLAEVGFPEEIIN